MSFRTRTEGELIGINTAAGSKASNCSTTYPNPKVIEDALGEFSSMFDFVTPNFHSRIRNGEVIINYMDQLFKSRNTSGTVAHFSCPASPCNTESRWDDGYYFYRPDPPGFGLVQHASVPIDVSAHITLASTSADANVVDPSFQGQVFLGELGRTLGMLSNPLGSLNKLLGKAVHAKRKSARGGGAMNVAEWISSEWLRYRYGIMPLVRDASNVMEALGNLSKKTSVRLTARGSSFETQLENNVELCGSTWECTRESTTTREVRARAGVIYETTFADTFGVGWQSIPATVWELIPFSFVVDWFGNVGNYVQAISPKVGVSKLGSWYTWEDNFETVAITTSEWKGNPACTELAHPSGTEVKLDRAKHRRVGSRIGITSRPIPFSGDYGRKRILDTLALTTNLLLVR